MRNINSATRLLSVTTCLFLATSLQLAGAQSASRQSAASRQTATTVSNYEEKKRETNDIAVTIVVSGLSCTCARFAEDIRNVVNDLRPDGIRVLPMLGVRGSAEPQ